MSDEITPQVEEQPQVQEEIEASGQEEITDEYEDGSEDYEEEGSEELQTAEEIQQEIRRLNRLKIKYNGKEYEEELPFEIDDDPEVVDYMRKQLQLAKMSQSKAQEFSQLQREVEGFITELRKNPRKVLSDPNIGIDLKAIAQELLQEEIENSQKSPEQLAKEEAERELKELREELKRQEEERAEREFQLLLDKEYERYDYQMSQALEKSQLPKSPYVVKKMSEYAALAVSNKVDVSMDDIASIVEDEIYGDIRSMFEVAPIEVIEQLLGTENMGKLRKRRVEKAKKKVAPPTQKALDVGKTSTQKKEDNAKPQTFKDFFGV